MQKEDVTALAEEKGQRMIVRIYVLGPLDTHGDREQNEKDSIEVGRRIIGLGGIAIVPHMYNLGMGHCQPREWWLKVDLAHLSTCHAAMCRDYWERSMGSRAEVVHCKTFGIPLFYNNIEADWSSLRRFILAHVDWEDPHEGS